MASMDALLRITAKGDTSGLASLTRGLEQVKAAGSGVGSALGGIGGIVGSLTGGIVALGAGLSAAGLAAFAKQTIDAADDMRDLSQRTGVTVENLSRFDQAARMSGTSIESVGGAMVKLSRGLSEAAATGKGAASDALKTLGISATDAAGRLRGADQVLLDVADRFAQMPDGAQKAALAVQLLGKRGAELIPMLNEGRQAIEGLDASMTSAFADNADEFNDNLQILGALIGRIGMEITGQLLPSLIDVTAELASIGIGIRNWFIDNRQPISDFIGLIGSAAGYFTTWSDRILNISKSFGILRDSMAWIGRSPLGQLFAGLIGANREVEAMAQNTTAADAEVQRMRARMLELRDATAAAAEEAAEHKRQVEEAKAQQEAFNVAVQQSNAQYELLGRTIDATSQAIQGQGRLRDAVLTADVAVNNAAKSILEAKLAQTKTDAEKIPILKQIMGIELENARLQKAAAEEQIAAEVRITDLKRQKAWQELRSAQAALATAEAYGQQTARLQEQVNLMKVAANSADAEFKLQQQIATEKRRANDATFQAQQTQIMSRPMPTLSAGPAGQPRNPAGGLKPMGYINGVPYWSQAPGPGFATGAYVTGPTRAVFGEAGPEYAIPERRMAAASAAYLSGARGAAVLQGAALPSAGSSMVAPRITIQTGPVLQQDGRDWVSMDDLEAALDQYGRQLMGQLRTPAARIALGG